jgi:hypothetical protein
MIAVIVGTLAAARVDDERPESAGLICVLSWASAILVNVNLPNGMYYADGGHAQRQGAWYWI